MVKFILPYVTLQIKVEYSTPLVPKATSVHDPEQLGDVIITSFPKLMLHHPIILDLPNTALHEYSLSNSSGVMCFL
jgi:hypothetical protein